MPVGDLLRYAFLTILGLVLLGFGLNWWGKHKTTRQITVELQSLTSNTSSFEQFYEADAKKTLFKSIHQLHLADTKLGLRPRDMLDKVFRTRKDSSLFNTSDPTDRRRVDPAEELIRTGLERNYENSERLGLLDDPLNLEALARGEAPLVKAGPATGKVVQVGHIISPEVSPGIEKIIPNLVIRPPAETGARPTQFEIAQAKQLANSLYAADLIEDQARERILEHYDNIGKPVEDPAPVPSP